MALWCSNVLTVSGPEDELVRFLEQAPTVRQAISGSDWVDYTEALDFENFVPGANDQIGKSGALNSRLSEREPGRAVFTFETPYSAPVEVYARLAECFPLLVFHCEFVGEEADCRGRFHAADGRHTVEYDDVRAEFSAFGAESAAPQSSLRVVRQLADGSSWAHRGRLLVTEDGRLIIGLSQVGSFEHGGVYQITADGEVQPLRTFAPEKELHFGHGVSPGGSILLGVATERGWHYHPEAPTTIFRIDRQGAYSELFELTAHSEVIGQTLPCVQTADGALYGLTATGIDIVLPGQFYANGAAVTVSGGSVFRIVRSGQPEIVHRFSGEDGQMPTALTLGTDGSLYGVTSGGGDPGPSDAPQLPQGYSGSIAFVSPAFGMGLDAEQMHRRIQQHIEMMSQPRPRYPSGCGVLFRLIPNGPLEVLHHFSGDDGVSPNGLCCGRDGILYGTTSRAGRHDRGTLFCCDVRSGQLEVLYHFTPDEGSPAGSLTQATDGGLWGTSSSYGEPEMWRCGTVFRFRPGEGCLVVHHFELIYSLETRLSYKPNGSNPSGLVAGIQSELFGLTGDGGAHEGGTLFRVY
ncbi:choice-of-anchor tandem repeat GloVer-containing protein [Gloeobacter morelensis]|uniref:Uncharacterized protein n=1 Tax=Gloeobacter morelensis MG652769 TaxID=2781736 RepID=A0ABY3PKS6_9CYAN|nr:choice-of-anchor tandem repeat GloVer-containing protein [Gloeobacter morelensis]UFP94276.1 hypothetical protein ISF26_21390 [Gloeobacter morelensis MG652769]